jgi:hypothetical protein
MNWLKNLLNGTFNTTKANALREIDRAIEKLEGGATVAVVVEQLRERLTQLLATAKLPVGGAILLNIVLAQVNWPALLGKLPADALAELKRLRLRVEGARL